MFRVRLINSDDQAEKWLLGQDPGLGDCEQFKMEEQPDAKVAFKTCADMVVTAADGGWPGDMAWSVVAETNEIKDWEKFTLEP